MLSQPSVSSAASRAREGNVIPLFSAFEASIVVLLRRGAPGLAGASFSSVSRVSDAIEGTRPDVVCRLGMLRAVDVGAGAGACVGVALLVVDEEKLTLSMWPAGAYRVPAGVSFLPAFSAFLTSARRGRASACL